MIDYRAIFCKPSSIMLNYKLYSIEETCVEMYPMDKTEHVGICMFGKIIKQYSTNPHFHKSG